MLSKYAQLDFLLVSYVCFLMFSGLKIGKLAKTTTIPAKRAKDSQVPERDRRRDETICTV